ncbi:hypothetical protein ILYODFUR_026620 [Ilyodon furcidens]|uniref:Secreted protein n=1 Tax=Ilyodon furcidens TaxID=33524 RepID=A0ABV0VKD4_9TELE
MSSRYPLRLLVSLHMLHVLLALCHTIFLLKTYAIFCVHFGPSQTLQLVLEQILLDSAFKAMIIPVAGAPFPTTLFPIHFTFYEYAWIRYSVNNQWRVSTTVSGHLSSQQSSP